MAEPALTEEVETSSSLDAVFAVVRSQTAFEETVERLGTAIKLGLLAPGTRLPAERELCTRLGIARSTLRQALIALGQSGHVRAVRGRGGGTFVSDPQPPAEPPTPELLAGWREVCDERMMVEVGITALAAERAQPEQVAALVELVAALDATLDDFPTYRQLDIRLHVGLAELTGSARLVKAMTDMNNKCPLTSYVLVGFSQGAVIAGDIASDVGNGRGPVDDDLLLGATLIADGRRQQGLGQDIGPNPPGEGAEIILHEVPVLSNLGLTMSGARPGGFGELNAKINEICGPGDLICAAPPEAFSLGNLPRTLDILVGGAGQPVHALYATTQFWSLDGQPATEWALNWAHNAIENAPHPKHG